MDFVFIDTNIIKKEQYFKQGNKIHTLKELALKNIIYLVTTKITLCEIKANLYADITSELERLSKSEALLSHLEGWKYPSTLSLETKIDKLVDDFFEGDNIVVLGYDYCDDAKSIFDQYFNHKPPFGLDKKKYEFPDAFVLSCLENFANENDDCEDRDAYRYVVLSLDKDIKNYNSDRLYIPDTTEYLSRLFSDGQNVDEYIDVIFKNTNIINAQTESQIRSSLLDNAIYYGALGNIKIDSLNLNECSANLLHVTPLVANNNNTEIVFECSSQVQVEGQIHYIIDCINRGDVLCDSRRFNFNSTIMNFVSVEKSSMTICNIQSDEPDLYDVLNKALLKSSSHKL